MAYIGNKPLLALALTPTDGAAFAGQNYIPVAGGVIPGLNLVHVGGAKLSPGDFDDSDGMGILLAVPMAAGTQYSVASFTANTSFQPVSGQLAPNRNKLINGNFDIWQRGTSLAATTGKQYLADRFNQNSTGTTIATSRQAFALGQTDVPGEPAYFARCVVASSAGAANFGAFSQIVEGVRALAGQSAMLSFWAKADASKNIAVEFVQSFGSGGSPSSAVFGIGAQLVALTSSWKQFKIPVSIPSIAAKTLGSNGDDSLGVNFWFDAGSDFNARTNSLGQQSGTFDIARVQLEPGSVATAYEDEDIGTTLRRCHRFCQATYGTFTGLANNATSGEISVPILGVMRAVPTLINVANGTYVDGTGAAATTGATLAQGFTSGSQRVNFTSTGMTQSRAVNVVGQSLRFEAEL